MVQEGHDTCFGRRRSRVLHWIELLPFVETAKTAETWKKRRVRVTIREKRLKMDNILCIRKKLHRWVWRSVLHHCEGIYSYLYSYQLSQMEQDAKRIQQSPRYKDCIETAKQRGEEDFTRVWRFSGGATSSRQGGYFHDLVDLEWL